MSRLQIATLLGFVSEQDGRFWNESGTMGVHVNDDQTITLLDSDGVSSNHALALDHAQHILNRARQYGDDEGATMRRWDNYASSI